MRTRSALFLGLSASVLGLTSPAFAQQKPNVGQQIQQQLLNNLENRVLGQPNNAYPNQTYSPQPNQTYSPYQNQTYSPYQNQATRPYEVQRPAYGQNGYQPRPGQGYSQPGYRHGYPGQPATQRYQLPAQYRGYGPGSSLSYGGTNYVVNHDGTMSPATHFRPAPAPLRYQIPAQFAGAAPGSTVTYGAAHYAINNDGTMSPLAGR